MSLTASLNNALSSIQALQSAVRISSDNIANATNEDYNARQAVFQNLQFGGVEIAQINRLTQDGLLNDLFRQISAVGSDSVQQSYFRRLEELTGSSTGSNPLVSATESFRESWRAFEAAPESEAAQREIVTSADLMVREIERLAAGIEAIDADIEREIQRTVTDLNTALGEIDRLNGLIARESSAGRPTANLVNQREAQLDKVAEFLDIRIINNPDATISVYSTTGYDLVQANASTFTWTEGTQTLSKSGVTGAVTVGEGRLGALIGMVRTDVASVENADPNVATIEKLRNQLDEFTRLWVDDATAQVKGSVNLNDTTDVVASFAGITAGNTIDFSENGAAAVTYTVPASATPAQVAAGISALSATLSARVTADGRIEVSTTAGTLQVTDTAGTAGATLGITTTGALPERDPPTFARAYADATLFDGATELDGGATERIFTVENGALADLSRFNFGVNTNLLNGTQNLKRLSGSDVVEALDAGNRTYNVSGVAIPAQSYAGIAAGILAENSRNASAASEALQTSDAIRENLNNLYRNEVGVSIDEETARLVVLQNNYAASARVIDVTQQLFDLLERVV